MAGPDRAGFVARLYPIARRYAAKTGIPAEVFIGIAAHESNFGNAGSTFGIKGKGATYRTHEVVDGRRVEIDDSFRTYPNDQAAFEDFIGLVSGGRYTDAWEHLQETGDWQGFLRGLNRAGYATDPDWSGKIARFTANTIAPLLETLGPRKAEAAELDQGGPPMMTDTAPYPGALPTNRNDPNADVRLMPSRGTDARMSVIGRYQSQLQSIDERIAELESAGDLTREERSELTAKRSQANSLRTAIRGLERQVATVEDAPPQVGRMPRAAANSRVGDTRPTRRVIGGRPHTWNPETEEWDADAVAGNSPASNARMPGGLTALQQAQLERLRQQSLGPQAMALQNHFSLIGQAAEMVKSGKLTQAEADRYLATSKLNFEAGLRGSTAAAEEAARQAAERADRQQGEAILARRLQVGTGLAQNLLGQAAQVMMPKGASSLGFDPGAAAWALTEQMGGGPEVGQLAKSLMLGARGGQPPGPAPEMPMLSPFPGQPSQAPGEEMPPPPQMQMPGPEGTPPMPPPPMGMGTDPMLDDPRGYGPAMGGPAMPPGGPVFPPFPPEGDPMRNPAGLPLSVLLPMYARPGAFVGAL